MGYNFIVRFTQRWASELFDVFVQFLFIENTYWVVWKAQIVTHEIKTF